MGEYIQLNILVLKIMNFKSKNLKTFKKIILKLIFQII